jgi:hypothetical protein
VLKGWVGTKELEELHVEINELRGLLTIFPSRKIHKQCFASLKIKLTRIVRVILKERTSTMVRPFVAN